MANLHCVTVELAGTDLVVAYGRTAVVHEVSLSLRRGQVTALVGPNGSGKSTMLRALCRLHPPTSGEVTLGDHTPINLLRPKQLARRVTMLSQSRGTPGGVTVREVVEYGRHPHRTRFGQDESGAATVARAMAMTGVTELAERPVDTLSGGQLQRVWLAGCLAQDTQVLLLDEPTTYLDLRYQAELLDIIRDLADDHDIAVGVVLHDLDHAASIADEVVLLVDGRVAAAGPVEQVLTSDNLSAAYGVRVEVQPDPATGLLRTRALGRHHHRQHRQQPQQSQQHRRGVPPARVS